MKKVTECSECGSKNLKWHCGQKNLTGVQDGLLRMHDVGTEFYLGCESCSDTLQVVSGDKVAEFLNNFTIEDTLIALAQAKLAEYKSALTFPCVSEEERNLDVLCAFWQLSQLVKIAHIMESGLSEKGIQALLDIEQKRNSIARKTTN